LGRIHSGSLGHRRSSGRGLHRGLGRNAFSRLGSRTFSAFTHGTFCRFAFGRGLALGALSSFALFALPLFLRLALQPGLFGRLGSQFGLAALLSSKLLGGFLFLQAGVGLFNDFRFSHYDVLGSLADVFALDKHTLFANLDLDGTGLARGVGLLDLAGRFFRQRDFLAIGPCCRTVRSAQVSKQFLLVRFIERVAAGVLEDSCGLELLEQRRSRAVQLGGELGNGSHCHVDDSFRRACAVASCEWFCFKR
jgi:hypothetical protein